MSPSVIKGIVSQSNRNRHTMVFLTSLSILFPCLILGTLSMFGAFCGVASSVFVALNAIYTTRCLPCVDNNVWRLCLYNNFNACILFIPLMLIFGESSIVVNYPKIFNLPFWFAMTMAGLLGFSMGYVTGYQIQMTSPLTHNVSGTAKSYVQTLLAVVIYTEVKIDGLNS